MQTFEHWIKEREASGRPLKPSSEQVYRAMWRSLRRALGDEDWRAVSPDRLERALRSLHLSEVSYARYLQLVAKVLGDGSAADALLERVPQPPRKLPVGLPPQEEARIERRLEGLPLRERALVQLYLGGGLRAGEAVRLRRDDVFLEAPVPWVVARNSAYTPVRAVPLRDAAVAALRAWLSTHDSEYVFPGVGAEHMATGSAWRLCRRLLGQDAIGPRRLRTAFAVRQLGAGESLTEVGKWVGHRRTETTAILLNLVPPSRKPV